jgi:ATP-dependent DNA helicase RecG
MDDAQLEALLKDVESFRSERTESAKDPDKIGEAICAFSNDMPGSGLPGVLFLGARDDGSCAGLTVTDQLLQTLLDYRADARIQPIPSFVVEKRTLAGCQMAVVAVDPSIAPPVRYKGKVCVRTGPRHSYATPEQEGRLNERRRFRDMPFDVRPVYGATLDDLDLDFFRKQYLPAAVDAEVLAQNQRSIEHQLASLRFVTLDVPPVPTAAGILAIGKDPEHFIGGAIIQFLRFDGLTLADPIRSAQRITGPLPEALRRIDEVLNAHIAVAVDFTSGPLESRRTDYPLVALQQIVRNAVMHRTYEGTNAPVKVLWFTDRIEIHSPGGPFGQVSIANFGHLGVADYRNRAVAEVLHNLGFVQRFGAGIALTRSSMEKNGNPPPEFGVYPEYIQVVLRGRV